MRARTAALLGLISVASATLGASLLAGFHTSGLAPPLLFALVVACIMVLAAAWVWAESEIVRPIDALGEIALAFDRDGTEVQAHEDDGARTPPLSPWRSVDTLAGVLNEREHAIEDALSVERALLRDVNHRIKNNLQMVASILAIEARADESHGAVRARDRIRLLSLAHERVHALGDVQDVRIDELVGDIGLSLMSARGATMCNVDLGFALDPVTTTSDRAVPMAFLIGESLSYALDALDPDAPATLTMSLHTDADGSIVFSLAAADWRRRPALLANARRLMDAFALQLGAEIAHTPSGPCLIRIRLPLREAAAA